jgi:hypothetical protein
MFNTDAVPQAPEDNHYGLKAKFIADKATNKIDLVIGAYRDDDGKPWVLPVVKKARMHNAPLPRIPIILIKTLSRQMTFSTTNRIGTMNIFLFLDYQVLPPRPKSLFLAPTPAPSEKTE